MSPKEPVSIVRRAASDAVAKRDLLDAIVKQIRGVERTLLDLAYPAQVHGDGINAVTHAIIQLGSVREQLPELLGTKVD